MEETFGILQVLSDHTSEVTTCDISSSNALATGAGDKTVRVWEWSLGKGFTQTDFSPLQAHKYGVTCVRFSPRGTLLASSSLDGTTIIWNARTGCRIHTLVQPTRCSVRRVEFTPDSAKLVTSGDDGIFAIWGLLHGSIVASHRLHADEDASAQGLAVSPDGQLLVTGDTGGLLQLWSLPSQNFECLSFHRNVNDGVTCCVFSPSRRIVVEEEIQSEYTLATSGCDGTVRIWAITIVRGSKDVSTDVISCDMIEMAVLRGHNSDIHDLRFNATGSLLGSIGLDKTLKIWEVSSGECLQSFSGHTRYGNCCAFTKDSNLVVTGSNDRTLIVWDVNGTMSLHSSLTPPCTLSSHFSTEQSGQEQLMAGEVERKTGRLEIVKVISSSGVVNSVAFGSSSYLAVAGSDKIVKIWQLRDGEWECRHEMDLHQYSINQVRFSPCGTRLVSCSLDGVLIHWDLQTGLSCELRNAQNGAGLRCCAFSPTSDVIACGGDDETVILYDSATMEYVRDFSGHRDAVTDVSFSLDGALLASTSVAGDIVLYDLEKQIVALTRDNIHDLGALSCSFASLDFLPADGGFHYVLATGGNDSYVRIWRASVSELSEHAALTGHGGNVMCVRFSPTVPHLLGSTATDNTARIWNVKSGESILVIEQHSGMVNSCAFSQDSSLFVTGSMDRTAVIWQLAGDLDSMPLVNFRNNKRLQQWSSEDLNKWLVEFDHPSAGKKILENGITGRQVLMMDETDLIRSLNLEDDQEGQELCDLLWWAKQEAQGDKEVNSSSGAPHQFLCPITHDIMRDPVLCADGFTYERSAITEWVLAGRFTSPMTNQILSEATFQSNVALKKAICRFLYGDRPA